VLLEDVSKRARVEQSNAEFVQNAAHQLRTPIAGIASSVAALEAGAGDDPEKRDRFLGHIRRESDRMARLVDALLTLAGLQRGVGLPLSELVPLRPLLEEVAEAESVGRIDVSCAAEIAVVGDRDLLGQAIGNVIANAVQHGGEARAVHVRARLDDAIVHLDVTDEGPGVSAESGDRVFERFYRATSERRGSGLGLAIAAAAAEATNGTLELLPSTGTGATFRFTLPGASLVGGGLR
jgi:signal transduction histidine kinase